MNDRLPPRLSVDEIAVLTFAARRQLTRWANRGDLQPREREQRAALVRAIRALDDRELVGGCGCARSIARGSFGRSSAALVHGR